MSFQLVEYGIHACLILSGHQYSLLLHLMCYTLISKSNFELLNQITTDMTQEFSQVFVEADRRQYMHAKLQSPFALKKGSYVHR